VDRFPGPEPVEQFQVLVEHVAAGAVVGLLADVLPLEGKGAGADAEGEPAAAEPVEGGGLPGDDHGTTAGERRHESAEPDRRRRAGRRGERDPRVDDGDRTRSEGEEVVPEEEAVPARPFGGHRPVGDHSGVHTVTEAGEGEPESHVPTMPARARISPSEPGRFPASPWTAALTPEFDRAVLGRSRADDQRRGWADGQACDPGR
jgi:hypothetical protein